MRGLLAAFCNGQSAVVFGTVDMGAGEQKGLLQRFGFGRQQKYRTP